MKRITITLLLIILSHAIAKSQLHAKKDLYFKLDEGKTEYDKKVFERTVTIETTRTSMNYSFFIPCKCHIAGYLSFLGHNNPEVGEVSEPMRVITEATFKKLEFISFDDLVKLLKQYDLKFNDRYNLYFVEPIEKEKKKYAVYNVRFTNTFIDAQ